MIKIRIQIKDNKMFFSKRTRLNSEQKSLINTNVISKNELVFSDEYILENTNLVRNFTKELINDQRINTLVIKEFEIAPLVLSIVANNPRINTLYLLEESTLTYKICEKIIKTNSIRYVSLYNIPSYLLEILDEKKIIVNSRNEMLFISSFMQKNNLENFSSLYYKTSINLNFPLDTADEEDFISFININRYLKNIYVNKLDKNDIECILDILNKKKYKNIKIYIKDNINDANVIEYLKKINKKYTKNNKIQFKIDYSKEYLQNNLINQIHLNTIKMCIMISLILVSFVVFYVFYSNYNSMQKVEKIQDEINLVIAKTKEDTNLEEDNEEKEEVIGGTIILTPNITTEPKTKEKEKNQVINKDLLALKEINKDTVGWLKVNNTNVDYPVVQGQDNDYYLNHNFKNQNDASGWVFMDYRVDTNNLSQNNIIYGHNMYYSGVMFGTLYKTKHANWYANEENQIIEYNSLYQNMKWRIFSIYVTPNTTDYLTTDFSSDQKFQQFIDLVANRSLYNFNIPIALNDKILTLSTCSNNGKNRLVIHAVLIKE